MQKDKPFILCGLKASSFFLPQISFRFLYYTIVYPNKIYGIEVWEAPVRGNRIDLKGY